MSKGNVAYCTIEDAWGSKFAFDCGLNKQPPMKDIPIPVQAYDGPSFDEVSISSSYDRNIEKEINRLEKENKELQKVSVVLKPVVKEGFSVNTNQTEYFFNLLLFVTTGIFVIYILDLFARAISS